jgi:putative glutamine amidotransferase
MSTQPVIGITVDVEPERCVVGRSYVDLVTGAGAAAVLLPPCPEHVEAYLRLCDGFVLSGGDDPDMTQWGVAMHPKARALDPRRQAFETALLERLDAAPVRPVLGICLGMQLMALHAGGDLDQHLPDTLPTADRHWGHGEHPVRGPLGDGLVHSHHRQAITDPGTLAVVAESADGVIEAVRDERRAFYLGVQWHPERTDEPALGSRLFADLVEACTSVAGVTGTDAPLL